MVRTFQQGNNSIQPSRWVVERWSDGIKEEQKHFIIVDQTWRAWLWGMNSYFTGFLIKISRNMDEVATSNAISGILEELVNLGSNDSSRWMWNWDPGPIFSVKWRNGNKCESGNSKWEFFSLSLLSNVGSAPTLKAALGFHSGGGGFQENSILSAKSLLSPG